MPGCRAFSRYGFLVGLASVVLAAIAIQLRLGVYADPLWLSLLCDRLLDGQVAYVDFLENSPPAAILIYMPPVLVARFSHAAREPYVVAYVFGLAGVSLVACGYFLARAKDFAGVGRIGALAAASSLLLLPDYAFGQRDHIALIFVLPFLSVCALRVLTVQPPAISAIAAGVAVGLVVSIRPHYALCFAFALAYVGSRRGFLKLFAFAEVDAALASTAFGVAASLFFFPNYVTRMLPIVRDAYVPFAVGWSDLLLNPIMVACGLLATGLVVWRDRVREMPTAILLIAAALGAIASFFIQLKGFPYHGYVAVALLFMAFAFVAAQRLAKWDAIALAALSVAVGWFAQIDAYKILLVLLLGTYLVAGLVADRFSGASRSKGAYRPISLVAIGYAFAGFGVALGILHLEWRASPPFENEVRALGANPKIAAIAPVGLALPLVSRVGGEWTLPVIGLTITDGVDSIAENQTPDASTLERLEGYKLLERDLFLSSVKKEPPDAIIVADAWAKRHFDYYEVQAWLDNYHVGSSEIFQFYNHPVRLILYFRNAKSSGQ